MSTVVSDSGKISKIVSISDGSINSRTSRLQKHFSSSRINDNKIFMKWEDINYTIREKDSKASKFLKPVYKEKRLLKSISGIILALYYILIRL